MALKEYVLKEKDYIVELRRYFHKNPEESLKEFNTANKIEEELDKLNIPHKRVGETGVIGIIRGEVPSSKVVALRADIDGLKVRDLKDVEYKSNREGYIHGCGHDGHTASLLGTAKILSERREKLKGEVRLFFQQAEELGQGAKIFLKEDALKGVDSIFGVHVASDIPVGQISVREGVSFASCDYFKIKIKGKAAHASRPHQGIDALYIASQIVVNLQSIVSRQTNPLDSVLIAIGTLKAGTIYNAVASEAVLEGSTRAFSKESREKTNKAVREIANSIAKTYGAEAEIEFRDYASPLNNDPEVVSKIKEIAGNIIGEENILKDYPKKLGSDDFAEYLLKVPGAYAQIGTRNENKPYTCSSHHNELFDIDEDGLLVTTNLEVDYVLKELED